MARSRETKIELTAYDDLFQTDESREEAKLSKIRDIPISEIDEFPDHPFKVLMDEDMEQLVESIKRNGVMTPATVRLKEDGRYELNDKVGRLCTATLKELLQKDYKIVDDPPPVGKDFNDFLLSYLEIARPMPKRERSDAR